MLSIKRILVRTIVLGASTAALLACGQPGPLYLPKEPAAAKRATLPQTLLRALPTNSEKSTPQDAAPTPASPASTPASQ
jgi:predicted small lipoprotein YifL